MTRSANPGRARNWRATAWRGASGDENQCNPEIKIGDHTKEPVAKPKVLVIGDEYLGGSIVEYLGAAQYDVMRLESYGKYDHILKKMQEEKLSLAILTNNTMTPPMLLEFLPKVRSIAKDFPILVLSGCVEPQFVIKMRELGADDFMAMPCDWEDLVSAVKRLTPAV